MPEFAPGDVFVDHRIEGLAGRGGMGVVYRATQLGLERTVALKVIAPVLAEEEDFRRRFVAESKAAASIEHPNVIPVYYAGERDGVLFIVMRYVDGPDLRALVRAEGRLDAERAAHIVAQVGGALDAAHRHGLVHRDVKPANVLLGEDDHAYLTDFGLTKRAATTDGGGLSRAGGWVGTLGYVAPEQIRGERIDARTDVYALGCVLVHALTGSAPYMRDTDEATLWAHLNAPPPSETCRPSSRASSRARSRRTRRTATRRRATSAAPRCAPPAAARRRSPERNVGRGLAAPTDGRPRRPRCRARRGRRPRRRDAPLAGDGARRPPAPRRRPAGRARARRRAAALARRRRRGARRGRRRAGAAAGGGGDDAEAARAAPRPAPAAASGRRRRHRPRPASSRAPTR